MAVNNWRMIIEEIIPFYFIIMVFPIAWFSYIPTALELVVVYAFAFGVSLFNNHLYKDNQYWRNYSVEYQAWGEDVVDVVDILQKENEYLRGKLREVTNELEWVNDEMGTEESKKETTKE